MYTKAGPSVDHGTALAWDCKIKPSQDESARVGGGGGEAWGVCRSCVGVRLCCRQAALPCTPGPGVLAPPARPPSLQRTHGLLLLLLQILVGGTAVWQRRDCVMGGNLSTEFRLPKKGQ